MIRTLLALSISAVLAASANAEESPAFDLPEGVKVDLGDGWKGSSTDNPAVRLPAVKEFIDFATEIRIRKGGTGILVSAMKWKQQNGKNLDGLDLAGLTKEAAAQYLPQSVETEIWVESRMNDTVAVALTTFHARDGEEFEVAPGYSGGCVSTGNVRKGMLTMTVSIASESCDSDTHKTALAAFLDAHE